MSYWIFIFPIEALALFSSLACFSTTWSPFYNDYNELRGVHQIFLVIKKNGEIFFQDC